MGSACRIRSFPVLSAASLLAAALVGVIPAAAQTPPPAGQAPPTSGAPAPPVGGVTAPQPAQPTPEFGFERTLPEQESPRPNDYGERTRTIYQPAFVNGAVSTTRTSRTSGMRMGVSGWTAPRIPFDDRDANGFPALGFTIEWGTPMEPPAEPATPGKR